MSTHRTTDQADALLDQGAAVQRIAVQLTLPRLDDAARLDLAYALGRTALVINQLAEDVRQGRRPRSQRVAA